nr:MAG TPA: hypothetical protein [Caudoviricetes sp.]
MNCDRVQVAIFLLAPEVTLCEYSLESLQYKHFTVDIVKLHFLACTQS